ncbi:MAG: STAS domain-containing protein [Clostridia bacterium]|nr:STAS domain-containing protein [Clostridia bacterium]
MEINKIIENNICTLEISGRIDTQTSIEFQKVLDEILKASIINITLDFKNVEYMSSAGLRTILYAQKKINSMTADISENENIIKSSDKKDNNVGEKTPKLNVINVNDEVYEVFEMTGFTDFVNVKK